MSDDEDSLPIEIEMSDDEDSLPIEIEMSEDENNKSNSSITTTLIVSTSTESLFKKRRILDRVKTDSKLAPVELIPLQQPLQQHPQQSNIIDFNLNIQEQAHIIGWFEEKFKSQCQMEQFIQMETYSVVQPLVVQRKWQGVN